MAGILVSRHEPSYDDLLQLITDKDEAVIDSVEDLEDLAIVLLTCSASQLLEEQQNLALAVQAIIRRLNSV